MGLEIKICVACSERHALWRGAMTVHATASGDRCSGKVENPNAGFESKSEQAAKEMSRQTGTQKTSTARRKPPQHSNEAYSKPSGQPAVTRAATPQPKEKQNPPGSRLLPTTMAASLAKVAKAQQKAEQKARERRRKKLFGMHPRRSEPLDRGIYQVKGARPVSGGLPSLGRGR